MATTREKFVERCMDIVTAKPRYQLGCETKTACDCIGMVKYGLHHNGVSFSTSGTNWTFRNQITDARRISSAADLRIGDVVFKVKEPGDSGYALPGKYKPGGSGYNGDLTDYCHIGVVKSVSPLRIIHMTGPTAKTDKTIGKWKWAASLKSSYISDDVEPTPQPEPSPEPSPEPVPAPDPMPPGTIATVWAENGKPVKMRSRPSTGCNLYDELPVGTEVEVIKYADNWCRVNCGIRKGWYIMTKFLSLG